MDNGQHITYNRHKVSLTSPMSTATVIYSQSLPYIDGADKFNTFYSDIGNTCLHYCETSLFQRLDVKKEFSYRLSCKVTSSPNDLNVTLTVSLTDRTSLKKLQEYSETHRWNNQASAMLPKKRGLRKRLTR